MACPPLRPSTTQDLERFAATPQGGEPRSLDKLAPLVAQGYNCMDALNLTASLPGLELVLSRVIQQCHNIHGHSRITTGTRAFGDSQGRDRSGPLPVFINAIQCVPFVMPRHWNEDRFWDDLSGYAIHIDPLMRKVAVSVLHRCMTALPTRRDELVARMATYCVRLPDEYSEGLEMLLSLVLDLMQSWLDVSYDEGAAQSPKLANLKAVEAACLGLMCSNSCRVRSLAMQMAKLCKELHESSKGSQDGNFLSGTLAKDRVTRRLFYVHDIIQLICPSIVEKCYWDIGRWSDLWKYWRPLPPGPKTLERCMTTSQANEDVFRWARIMCELFKETWSRSPVVAQRAQTELSIKLQSLLVLDSAGRAALPQEGKYAQTAIYCLALAAGPATLPEALPDATLSKRDFVRLLITSIRAGLEFHQSVAAMALGNVHSSCHSLVVQECMVLTEDYLPDRQMQRVSEVHALMFAQRAGLPFRASQVQNKWPAANSSRVPS